MARLVEVDALRLLQLGMIRVEWAYRRICEHAEVAQGAKDMAISLVAALTPVIKMLGGGVVTRRTGPRSVRSP